MVIPRPDELVSGFPHDACKSTRTATEACWGLRHIDGYGVTFIDIPVADCGVPLAGHEAMLVP